MYENDYLLVKHIDGSHRDFREIEDSCINIYHTRGYMLARQSTSISVEGSVALIDI